MLYSVKRAMKSSVENHSPEVVVGFLSLTVENLGERFRRREELTASCMGRLGECAQLLCPSSRLPRQQNQATLLARSPRCAST